MFRKKHGLKSDPSLEWIFYRVSFRVLRLFLRFMHGKSTISTVGRKKDLHKVFLVMWEKTGSQI